MGNSCWNEKEARAHVTQSGVKAAKRFGKDQVFIVNYGDKKYYEGKMQGTATKGVQGISSCRFVLCDGD